MNGVAAIIVITGDLTRGIDRYSKGADGAGRKTVPMGPAEGSSRVV